MTLSYPRPDSAAQIQSLNGVLLKKNISTEMKKKKFHLPLHLTEKWLSGAAGSRFSACSDWIDLMNESILHHTTFETNCSI